MATHEEIKTMAEDGPKTETSQQQGEGEGEGEEDHNEEGSEDPESSSISPACEYCSFAVTGGTPSFQPIFVCNSCFNENAGDQEVPLCICQACADHCHDSNEHDVEYIGMGPSYCDCDHVGNCTIFQKSQVEAERMGIQSARGAAAAAQEEDSKKPAAVNNDSSTTANNNNNNNNNATSNNGKTMDDDSRLQDLYEIPCLEDATIAGVVVQHAQEVVKHTKESFWVDEKLAANNGKKLCVLEQLAWNIYQQHRQHYASLVEDNPDSSSGGGAEWWVQIKDTAVDNNSNNKKSAAIDLHYDKDEALAEAFGIGSFPVLSTVTYLTASPKTAAPTVVFDHVYAQGEEELINEMMVSRPRMGKHLVFDGSLLHGAPLHPSLQPTAVATTTIKEEEPAKGDDDDNSSSSSIRVTFLVNVWKDRKPASIQCLDDDIRQTLLALPSSGLEFPVAFVKQSIPEFVLTKEEDLPKDLRFRIELPFVSKGITWEDQLNNGNGDDDEEDGSGLVVITFPPPPTEDTLIIKFGAGLQAYLDYPQRDDDEGTKKGPNEPDHESGYV
jgi:hypothetical protein